MTRRRSVQQTQKSFSMMIGVRSRRAAASSIKARRSSAGLRANSSIAGGADLSDDVPHQPGHLGPGLAERPHVAIIQAGGDTPDLVAIDIVLPHTSSRTPH